MRNTHFVKRRQGFTLIELLAVLAIIGILAAIIVPKIGDATGKARRLACATNMKNIVKAMQIYHEDRGRSPVTAIATDSTLEIFGNLYYVETDENGDQKAGVTSMKLFNCPSSSSTSPEPSGDYGSPLSLTGTQMIDYGLVDAGNTLNYKQDPDGNVVMVEIAVTNHGRGRNIAFWDSSVQFIPFDTDNATTIAKYPVNKVAATGANLAASANYTAANAVIDHTTTRKALAY